jgi:hypothetical protein
MFFGEGNKFVYQLKNYIGKNFKFKERKKYISEKLDYLGYNEKQKRKSLRFHYGLISRITRNYVDFERLVCNDYEKIKEIDDENEFLKKENERILKRSLEDRFNEWEKFFKREGENVN